MRKRGGRGSKKNNNIILDYWHMIVVVIWIYGFDGMGAYFSSQRNATWGYCFCECSRTHFCNYLYKVLSKRWIGLNGIKWRWHLVCHSNKGDQYITLQLKKVGNWNLSNQDHIPLKRIQKLNTTSTKYLWNVTYYFLKSFLASLHLLEKQCSAVWGGQANA